MSNHIKMTEDHWPALPLESWRETYQTLHMWTQIVGKIRMELSPFCNHWWHVPLYVTARGLTTSPIPIGDEDFQIDFDFVDHRLVIDVSDGREIAMPLVSQSVAQFYLRLMGSLKSLGIDVDISPIPCEVTPAIPFDQDRQHASYDPDSAHRLWQILVECDSSFKDFRGKFIGKCSPVHFFWGSFDMAVTRFNGKRAPEKPGADPITREAYSHEVISHGFWPGGTSVTGVNVPEPIFYSYGVPEPAGFKDQAVKPREAFYHRELGEWVLPYEAVRRSDHPAEMLQEFLESTYEAGANCANWDRAALERMA